MNKNISDDPIERCIGAMDRYQILLFTVLSIARLPSDYQLCNIVFLIPRTEFTCLDRRDTGENVTSQCPCDQPDYDTSVFESTVGSTWGLLCDRNWLLSLSQSMFQLGILFGSLLLSAVSDRYGRKIAVVASLICVPAAVILSSVVPEYWMFAALRFVTGAGVGGTMLCVFTFQIEMIGKSFRPYMAGLDQVSYLIAYLTIPGIAYKLRIWWHLQLATSVPWLVIVLVIFWILPESPRWLIAIGRKEEGVELLKRIAIWNKRQTEGIEEIVEQHQIQTKAEDKVRGTFVDLFKTAMIRRHAFIMALVWMCCSFGFFGANQYIGRLAGNIYLNVFISASLHIPGIAIALIAIIKLKRRLTLSITFGVAAVCTLALIFVPENVHIAKIFFGATGLIGMFLSFLTIYLYATEIFPTVIRNSALGFASVFARLGGFIAPFVVDINTEWIPLLIFSIAALLAIVLCYFLPETKGIVLKNHIMKDKNQK